MKKLIQVIYKVLIQGLIIVFCLSILILKMKKLLILQKKLVAGYSYCYIPRGFTMDWSDTELLRFMTEAVKDFCRRHKAIFFKIDPDIRYHVIDDNGKPVPGENNEALVLELKRQGYEHLPLTYFFDSEQPRYTFRIRTDRDLNDVRKGYDKIVKRRLRQAASDGVEIVEGGREDIGEFVRLMTITEQRQGWWRKEYAKYDTPQYVTGEMSLDDAVYITEQMLEYCIGHIDTLDDTEATIDGVTAPFFTEREKQHLADCRNIFLGAVKFRIIAVLAAAALLIAVWFSVQKRIERVHGRENGSALIWPAFARVTSKGYLKALAAFIIFALFLIIVGMHDFTFLFTKFHHVFFDNDLWILDPRHDNLVNVMQESVFSDAAVTIGSIWAAVSVLLAGISAYILKK